MSEEESGDICPVTPRPDEINLVTSPTPRFRRIRVASGRLRWQITTIRLLEEGHRVSVVSLEVIVR